MTGQREGAAEPSAEKARTVTEQMHDTCACGDWRKDHFFGRGKCATCGDSRHPADGCREFRLFQECRMTFTVVSTTPASEGGGDR